MIIELIVLVIAILAAIVLFMAVKKLWPLIVNSAIALAALWIVNLMGLHVAITIWSFLIVLIGGLPGLALVVLLHVLGWAF